MGYTDDLILNSMMRNHEDNPESLEKALNRAGLVQKDVQYKTKSGKIATRKQWVKAGEDQPVQKPAGKPDEKKSKSNVQTITHNDTNYEFEVSQSPRYKGDCNINITNTSTGASYLYHDVPKSAFDSMDDKSKIQAFVSGKRVLSNDNTIKKPSKDQPVQKPAGKMSLIDIRNTSEGRKLIDSIEEAEEEIRGRGIDVNDTSEVYVNQRNHGIKQLKDKFGYDWENPSKKSSKDQPVQKPAGNSEENAKKEDISKEVIKVRDSIDNSGTATTTNKEVADMYRSNKNPNRTFSVKDNKDGSYTITSPDSNKSDDSSKSSLSTPSSKQDLIKLLQSGASREDIMAQAEKDGITWKKSDHAGINWMRASMAITGTTTKGSKSEDNAQKGTQQSTEQKHSKEDKKDKTSENSDNKVNQTTSKTDIKKFTDKIEQYKKDYDEDSYVDAWYEDSYDETQKMYDNDEITIDEMFEIRQKLLKERENFSRQKNTKPVMGTDYDIDYTKLATYNDFNGDSIKVEAHNMIVHALGGKKNPSSLDIMTESENLAKHYIERSLLSGLRSPLANRFLHLAGNNREDIVRDIAMNKNSKKELKACALQELLGKNYRVTPGHTVVTSADVGGKYEAEVKIEPMSGGHFSAEFIYADGASRKETYDSIDSVKEASDKFIKKEKEYNSK